MKQMRVALVTFSLLLWLASCSAQPYTSEPYTRVLAQTVQIDNGLATFVIDFTPFDFPVNTVVSSVIPSVTFWKIGGTNCLNIATPQTESPDNNELQITLTHNGIEVDLISTNTFQAGLPSSSLLVSMTFDSLNPEALALTRINGPTTGVFYPSANLTAFVGSYVTGDWVLKVSDNAGGQVTCFYEFRLTVNCLASQTFQYPSPASLATYLPAGVPIINANSPQAYLLVIPFIPLAQTTVGNQVTIYDSLSDLVVGLPILKYPPGTTTCPYPVTALGANPSLQDLGIDLRFGTTQPSLVAVGSWSGQQTDTPPYTVNFGCSPNLTTTATWATGTFLPASVNEFCAPGTSSSGGFLGLNPIGTWSLIISNKGTGAVCFTTYRLTLDTCNSPSPSNSQTPMPSSTNTKTATPSVSSTASATASPSQSRSPSRTSSNTATNTAAQSAAVSPSKTQSKSVSPSNTQSNTPSHSSARSVSLPVTTRSSTPTATTTPGFFPQLCGQRITPAAAQYFIFYAWIDFYPPNQIQDANEPLASLTSTCYLYQATYQTMIPCDGYINPNPARGLLFTNVRYYADIVASATLTYCLQVSLWGTFNLPPGLYFVRQPSSSSQYFSLNPVTGVWLFSLQQVVPTVNIVKLPIGIIGDHGPNQDASVPQLIRKREAFVPAHPHF